MTLPNRVTPFATLEADPARGLLFGNRGGRFHDPATATVPSRPWASRQWICCLLDVGNRRQAFRAAGHRVWGARRYTELFFCDEVTALAAGHRPCTECRRVASLSYRDALVAAGAFPMRPACPQVDRKLDAERRQGRAQRTHVSGIESLPDGAMVALDGAAFAVRGDYLLLWTHQGYAGRIVRPAGDAVVLTPETSLAALRGGYKPIWHPSAEVIVPMRLDVPVFWGGEDPDDWG